MYVFSFEPSDSLRNDKEQKDSADDHYSFFLLQLSTKWELMVPVVMVRVFFTTPCFLFSDQPHF